MNGYLMKNKSVAVICSNTHTHTSATHINRGVVENLVGNVDWPITVITTDIDDTLSLITAERIEDIR